MDFTNFTPVNVGTETFLDCAHVGEIGPSDWIRTKNRQRKTPKKDSILLSRFPLNPCRWPAGSKTLDSPAVLANECDKSLIIAEGKIAAFCHCGKNAISINRASIGLMSQPSLWPLTKHMDMIIVILKGSQPGVFMSIGHSVLLPWIQTSLSKKIWNCFQLE